MSSGIYYAAFLTEQVDVALEELVQASGLAVEEIVELVEQGVFVPVSTPTPVTVSAWRFSSSTIALGRRASRLKADLDLNLSGLALALTFVERIEELEEELNRLRCGLLR